MGFDFIEMRFPAKAEYVSTIRLTISGLANRMGFSYDDIEDLKIAISEAVTNAVTHAYCVDEQEEVTVGFGIYEDRLEIMVVDHGGSFDLAAIKDNIGPYQSDEPIHNLREGGFGLYLIQALVDKVEINNTYGVIVLMTKFLNQTGVSAYDKISK